jgi:hypothetical protein
MPMPAHILRTRVPPECVDNRAMSRSIFSEMFRIGTAKIEWFQHTCLHPVYTIRFVLVSTLRMRQQHSQALLRLWLLSTALDKHLHPRRPEEPSMTCPSTSTLAFTVQPVLFSGFVAHNTIFDPFRDGHLVTVTNAPTTLITQSFLTRSILNMQDALQTSQNTVGTESSGQAAVASQPSITQTTYTRNLPFQTPPISGNQLSPQPTNDSAGSPSDTASPTLSPLNPPLIGAGAPQTLTAATSPTPTVGCIEELPWWCVPGRFHRTFCQSSLPSFNKLPAVIECFWGTTDDQVSVACLLSTIVCQNCLTNSTSVSACRGCAAGLSYIDGRCQCKVFTP